MNPLYLYFIVGSIFGIALTLLGYGLLKILFFIIKMGVEKFNSSTPLIFPSVWNYFFISFFLYSTINGGTISGLPPMLFVHIATK